MANTALIVSGLDFDSIRSNLRSFIASKPDFADFDFNDSAIGTLLDLLAYNTYYTSYYVNMAVNESFLDSAIIRDSVVSRAKMLGYIPRSVQGPTANVKISFTNAVKSATKTTITIPKNTQFTASINGVSYRFVTPQSYLVEANNTNGFARYIDIVEGTPVTDLYTYTTAATDFVLPNDNVDTRSISVTVTSGGNTQTYSLASDINAINSSSKIFFVEPDKDERYKVVFGDNVLGVRPNYNSTVAISYRISNGTRANGANNFSSAGTIGGESVYTLRTESRATGGTDLESISSIKYNAPRSYETQNRAVTIKDYERIILRDNGDVSAVTVWGGEDNDPPIYGKVFASVKPVSGITFSSTRKSQIRNALKQYSVVSIDTELVDPTYLYIVPNITVRYDPTSTSSSASQIASSVASRVVSYETNVLNTFDGKFRYSKFLQYLELANPAIVGSSATIDLQLRFVPSTTRKNNYTFKFNRVLEKYNREISGIGNLYSNKFLYKGFDSYLDDIDGNVRAYYVENINGVAVRTYSDTAVGTVNYTTGSVSLNEFQPSSFATDYLSISVKPLDPNIEPVRNQILLLSDVRVTVIDDNTETIAATSDSVATIGTSAFYETENTALTNITSY